MVDNNFSVSGTNPVPNTVPIVEKKKNNKMLFQKKKN